MSHRPGEPLVNNFKIPGWAGKPPPGLHLDVLKDGKLIQKLMIDDKKAYFFGRNRQLCDFQIDHQSCSRVHACLVWHKHLNRPFLIDCGSVHGTFLGRIRLESEKPQQVPNDSELHFGASTRMYIVRERPGPTHGLLSSISTDESGLEGTGTVGGGPGGYYGLPETERELDNLTEFNTAHNRRIASMMDVADPPPNPLKKRKRVNVNFDEQEDIINPEDVDPSVGRFRNLVSETFIPNKKLKLTIGDIPASHMGGKSALSPTGIHPPGHHDHMGLGLAQGAYSVAAKLGLPMPNLAPDVDVEDFVLPPSVALLHHAHAVGVPVMRATDEAEPRKKKYAKEAWPGKRPGFLVGPAT